MKLYPPDRFRLALQGGQLVVQDTKGARKPMAVIWNANRASSALQTYALPLAGGTMGGAIAMGGNDITGVGDLLMNEKAANGGGGAGTGEFWVKSDSPSTAWFTDDAGVDHPLLHMPYGGLYFSTPAETTISDTNFTKALGTTTITNQSSDIDDNSVSNRLRYTGALARHFHIVVQATVTIASGTNKNVGVGLYYYDDSAASGSVLAHSEARTTIQTTAEEQITSHADVMMDTNDYIELHVKNSTDTVNVTVELGYMFCVGMLA